MLLFKSATIIISTMYVCNVVEKQVFDAVSL